MGPGNGRRESWQHARGGGHRGTQELATAKPAQTPTFWGLSSDSLPARDRFDAWKAALSAFNDIRVERDDRPSFRASATYWASGSLTLSVNMATPLALARSDALTAREGLEHELIVVA